MLVGEHALVFWSSSDEWSPSSYRVAGVRSDIVSETPSHGSRHREREFFVIRDGKHRDTN